MSIKCAWASQDERGKGRGGRAGDQSGLEIKTGPYYDFGQTMILRPKSAADGLQIAAAAERAAKNNHIGYDQGDRTSLFAAASEVGWDPAKVKTNVETDCSALIAVLCRYAGIKISKDVWTGNLEKALLDTGAFEKLGAAYYNHPEKLRRGDIVLNPAAHVITVIEDGSKANAMNPIGYGILLQNMPARKTPNVAAKKIKTVKRGTKVTVFKTHKDKTGRIFWMTWPNFWIVQQDKMRTYIKRSK